MSEEGEKVVKAPPPYYPIKFFISSLNTFLGHALVRRLRNDSIHPDNPHRILGNLTESQMDVPSGVRKVIDTQKVKFFEEILLNSDVIIYDLNTSDLQEVETAISTLKIHPLEKEKVLICISNVMTWARTKPKQKKEGQEQDGDDNPAEEPDTEVEGEQEEQGKKTYVRFQDKDFSMRKPDPQLEKIKSMETLCMAAGKVNPKLKSYVVCSGMVYGEGERLFAEYFMQARMQKPPALTYYGNGKNRVPMVHIEDLVTYVEKVIQKRPELPYLLALDHNPKPTQLKVIEAISKGIGTGQVISSLPTEEDPNIKYLTLNLRMKPTMFFAKLEEEEAAIEVEEGNEIEKFKFKWVCKEGLQKNIKKLCEQFNHNRGLTQTKIFISGPPGSGKTHYAQQLSQKYYLPHIHIKSVIEQVKAQQTELGEQVRNYLSEKKEQIKAAKESEYEELKEKLKKIPKQLRDPLPPFNPDDLDVRLSDELVYKCFKWRLNRNDCLNRGYILDGYPRRYEDACEVFMGLPPVEEDAEPDENQQKIVEQKLVPNKLIVLDISDEQILSRLQGLSEQQLEGTHFSEHNTKKRLQAYRMASNSQTGQYILPDFFKENKIDIHHVDGNSETINIMESIIKPMSQNERQQQDLIQMKVKIQEDEKLKKREQMAKKQTIIRNIQNEDYMLKKQNEQNEERQILDRTSLALRKYLDVNLVPILSEGIVQILKDFPEDPVDKLAAFLFQNSLKVPNPDPSTFEF